MSLSRAGEGEGEGEGEGSSHCSGGLMTSFSGLGFALVVVLVAEQCTRVRRIGVWEVWSWFLGLGRNLVWVKIAIGGC